MHQHTELVEKVGIGVGEELKLTQVLNHKMVAEEFQQETLQ
jgi:hypothetical protein